MMPKTPKRSKVENFIRRSIYMWLKDIITNVHADPDCCKFVRIKSICDSGGIAVIAGYDTDEIWFKILREEEYEKEKDKYVIEAKIGEGANRTYQQACEELVGKIMELHKKEGK